MVSTATPDFSLPTFLPLAPLLPLLLPPPTPVSPPQLLCSGHVHHTHTHTQREAVDDYSHPRRFLLFLTEHRWDTSRSITAATPTLVSTVQCQAVPVGGALTTFVNHWRQQLRSSCRPRYRLIHARRPVGPGCKHAVVGNLPCRQALKVCEILILGCRRRSVAAESASIWAAGVAIFGFFVGSK